MAKSVFSKENSLRQAVKRNKGKTIFAAIAIFLLVSVTVLSTGCAANKCDCPKFGGRHLAH